MTISLLPVVAAALLALAPVQAPGDSVRAPVEAGAAATQVPGASAGTASGLPQRFPEPPTMREFWPVFVGFSLAWIGIVGFTLRSGRSVGRIGERVRQLGGDRVDAPGAKR